MDYKDQIKLLKAIAQQVGRTEIVHMLVDADKHATKAEKLWKQPKLSGSEAKMFSEFRSNLVKAQTQLAALFREEGKAELWNNAIMPSLSRGTNFAAGVQKDHNTLMNAVKEAFTSSVIKQSNK